MPESYGSTFPTSGVQQGVRHVDSGTGLIYRYIGGDPSNSLNWLVDGGQTSSDPDTTGWGTRHAGANWYNTTTQRQVEWIGTVIRTVSSQTAAIAAGVLTANLSGISHLRILLNQNITTMTLTCTVDGQKTIIEFKQDATGSRTVAWPSNVRFSSDLVEGSFAPSSVAGETSYHGLIYNASSGTFDALAITKGFA